MNIPLLLKPALKDYLWGGTKLRENWGKKSELDKVAESWELSCHKDGLSTIINGEDAGLSLYEYIQKYGKSVLGTNCERFDDFPVLIKLIDAKENLSVQVHPDNNYALRTEGGYGKTEMWYIVDCEEGASLIYGLKKEISKDEFKNRIENNTLTEVTKSIEVQKGDVFFIPAGTLHAIGKGILIAEIQQNSNTTYRIFDYGRKDKDGKSRELHIEKACDVTLLSPSPVPCKEKAVENKGYTCTLLSSCDYFTANKLDIEECAVLETTTKSFDHLLIIDGSCTIISKDYKNINLTKGDSLFIPAGYGDFTVDGKCSLIRTNID